ncbi:MAG: response regulator transcription factor [Chthoniobacterales bacterium]
MIVTAKLKILIVDDHPVVRFGLNLLLEKDSRFEICGEAGDVHTACEMACTLSPDIIILDLRLGGRDDLEMLKDMHALNEKALIFIFTAQNERVYAQRCFQCGAGGYMMKDEGIEKVPDALTVMLRGERYASEEVQSVMFQKMASGIKTSSAIDDLSDRELQVLRLVGAGMATGKIATELNLSVKTVSTYRERLKNKLGSDTARALEQRAADFIRTGRIS